MSHTPNKYSICTCLFCGMVVFRAVRVIIRGI